MLAWAVYAVQLPCIFILVRMEFLCKSIAICAADIDKS